MSVKVTKDIVADVAMAINDLLRQEILVGIPESKTERPVEEGEEPVTNAYIGYVNEYGSPAENIPPRPHLVPGVKDAEDKVTERMQKASVAALDGNKQRSKQQFEAAGVDASNSVKSYITKTQFQPLAARTIAARMRKGRKGTKPLIDTGEYRRSITYVLRESD